ncbi:MAG: molybdopterin-dependent oxidoreductase, partial [Oscillospiraceae bacterium]|nr:molybdopterin-dependent oxidoreductase [Oscillospiraceae bacterium]
MNIKKVILNINEVDRTTVCDLDKDNLAVVLRRLGLTSVKVGCGTGVCGACSIILDGKVVRACVKKMKSVAPYSKITTLEGIGTPQHLHPLQQAWITYGGVQCGFCSPGFIVSAFALLKENQSPSRQDVRDWFQKHRNICRCTGYKPLVDAVMAAAAVMRGEKTAADITYDFAGEEDIYGSNHPRPSALAKVTGLADYGDDVKLQMPESTLHLAVVLSEVPHAKILSIDTSEAEKMPGVVGVLTAKDVKGSNGINVPNFTPRVRGDGMAQLQIMAANKIRQRGECVALVAAKTEEQAREAAKLVKQNLELLPAYMTYPEAVMPNSIQIHDQMPNFYMLQPLFKGDVTDETFDDAAFVAEGSFYSQHEPHLPIEPDVVQGFYEEDGTLTLLCKAQAIDEARDCLSAGCGIPKEKLRIIMNHAGGSFGYSVNANTYGLVATAVQNLKVPCTLTLNYEEFNHITGKRSAAFSNGRLACDESGKIIAAEYDSALDHGAYTSIA